MDMSRSSQTYYKDIMTNWIKFSERQPSEAGRYLVCERPHSILNPWIGVCSYRQISSGDMIWDTSTVTHWQPLPSPPEAET